MRRDVQGTRSSIRDVAFEQRRENIERWLSPPNPSINYNRALQERQKGTGLWFLQSHVYTQWKAQRNSALWLYGKPGSGKTILSSCGNSVIRLRHRHAVGAHMYMGCYVTQQHVESRTTLRRTFSLSIAHIHRQRTREQDRTIQLD